MQVHLEAGVGSDRLKRFGWEDFVCLLPLEDPETSLNNESGWGEVLVIVYEGINAVFSAHGVYSLHFQLLNS